MKNIFITGAGGFIGQALLKKISTTNHIVGLYFDKTKCCHDKTHVSIQGDVRDYKLLSRIIGDYEIDTVFHLASQSIVRICHNDPITAYDININGTLALLEACRIVGANTVQKILVSSSDKAIGHSPAPYNEETPFTPKFTYETSKSCQDFITTSYFHTYNVPTIPVRCSNVYGPGDTNFSRLIPRTIRLLKEGRAPVLYNGVEEYEREFIYIDDVVDAFILLAEKGIAGDPYCVGGTGAYQIKELINIIIQLMNGKIQPVLKQKAGGFKEIQKQYIDASKLKALGWKSKVNLNQGLLECIKWY